MYKNLINQYLKTLIGSLQSFDSDELEASINEIKTAWLRGRNIFVCGNGGSALTASHYVTDWNKGIFAATGRPFLGRCLSDNQGIVTAYSNDITYNDVFSMQIMALGEKDDLLVAISGSGNSTNVINAVSAARKKGMRTLGICGYPNGDLPAHCDVSLNSRIHDMQIAEDTHLVFGHIVHNALCSSEK